MTRTEEHKLKDGRTLFKTHNGFKFWVEDKKGNVTEVKEAYWLGIRRNTKLLV